MRLVLAAVFLFTTSWAVPVGYVEIQTDSAPSQVFLDRQLVVMDEETVVAEAQPGKHFVSFYPPRKVFLAFKDEVPEKFWEPLREAQALGGERDLLSSYERGQGRDQVDLRCSRGHGAGAAVAREGEGDIRQGFLLPARDVRGMDRTARGRDDHQRAAGQSRLVSLRQFLHVDRQGAQAMMR